MNTQKATDERFMRRCLQLAANGLLTTKPNPMVGAVIVSADGRIIGEGFTSPVGGPHAEVNAFASVKPADEPLLPGATIYVSLEPCSHWGHTPPCCDLIIRKRVKRCVCGCVDPFAKVQGRGISRMREAGIEVTVGVLEAECKAINRRFMTFNELHRPYIILKWAQTANGYMAQSDRQPLRISTPFTMMLSHKLRSECDAILVGRTTFDTDHPQLTVRDWTGPNPERLVLTHRAINDAPASSLSPSASSSPSTPSTPLNPSAPAPRYHSYRVAIP
jgi:diaminohydroxyphosphoribosylaminopyrimidine deaminase/5-amino-6-(5-phosphoribosylamino)uracil reductase